MNSRPSLVSSIRSRPLSTPLDRKSTRLNSSHANISYAAFCLKKVSETGTHGRPRTHLHLGPPLGSAPPRAPCGRAGRRLPDGQQSVPVQRLVPLFFFEPARPRRPPPSSPP